MAIHGWIQGMSAEQSRALHGTAGTTRPTPRGGMHALFMYFRRHRDAGQPLVLATVVDTAGTTYRKPGAQMLITADEQWHGLLSGGCLESDLAGHARQVFAGGEPKLVDYQLSTMTDAVWGFGLGCDGSVRILLQKLDAANDWEPFATIVRCAESRIAGTLDLVCETNHANLMPGLWRVTYEHGSHGESGGSSLLTSLPPPQSQPRARLMQAEIGGATIRWLRMPLPRIPRIAILGGGPDAIPLVEFAAQLGWHVTLADHRPAYADPARFPGADRVLHVADQHLPADLLLDSLDAVVIMSHNLAADERYLAQVAPTKVPYIGLLGPEARRHKLTASVPGVDAADSRIHGPVGLRLGGEGPEAIALSIVAEIQSHLTGSLPRNPRS